MRPLSRPTAQLGLSHGYMAQPGGASGGLAGASIDTAQEQPPQLPPTTPDLFTLMMVDEAGPSRKLINNRSQPTAIGAHAQVLTLVL
jgi:hypothetical protein